MSTDLWIFFVLLSVEKRGITVLGASFGVNSSIWFCVLVYSLSLFHVLPPVFEFFVCSFFFVVVLVTVFHIASVCVEIYVTVILAIWGV